MSTNTLLAFCSAPDITSAERIAENLVEQRIAACVSNIPSVSSVYQWQGKIEHSQEVLMLIKLPASSYTRLQQAILALHPYETPEIIAVDIKTGLPGYLQWVQQCTNSST
ncbi:MAG: divalent-cation tolerance protein CutA [gamma proteobacterium symbiont of Bathyaustriella thionipta]|nr:divalent-cation tolerance protein CutA [gamma proteobacterium symbiont of Bathyaustriella thionipta]